MGDNIFGEKINNGLFISEPLILLENVKDFSSYYALTNDNNLYYWSSSILKPTLIDSQVDEIFDFNSDYCNDVIRYRKESSVYETYISVVDKNIETTIKKLDTNIKQFINNDFYLNKDGTLNFYGYNEIKNVREINTMYMGNEDIYVYITNDNYLYQISKQYLKHKDEYVYNTYLIASGVSKFMGRDAIFMTNDDLWLINDMASGAVNMPPEKHVNYPAKLVNELDDDNISAKGIYIYSETKRHVSVGDTIDILAVVLPYNATNKNILWSLDNEDIASITEDGVLTAKKKGNVRVYAATEDGGYLNYIDIYIYPVPNDVSIIDDDMNTFIYSESYNKHIGSICAKLLPEDALVLDSSVKWSSSDTSIITVGDTYYSIKDHSSCAYLHLLPNTKGNVTIKVETIDGKYSDSANFTIYPNVSSYDFENMDMIVGESEDISFSIKPDDYPMNDFQFVLPSEYDNVISLNGMKVTALKDGYAYIDIMRKSKSSLYDSDYSFDRIHVNVSKESLRLSTDVENIYVNASESEFTDRGTIFGKLKVKDGSIKAVWSSSDESIMKILPATEESDYYNISTNFAIGTKTGSVTLTATSTDGRFSDSITFNVIKVNFPTNEIVLDLSNNNTYQIPKFMQIYNFSDNDYGYNASDDEIVSVSNTGLITAKNIGETTIRVAVRVLQTVDDYAYEYLPVKVINSNNLKLLTINTNGGLYNGSTNIYGNVNDTVKISKPTKKVTVTLVADKTSTKEVDAVFDGWKLTGGGSFSNDIYTFGEEFGVLVANWKYNKVTLTTPTKDGYKFDGWYTDSKYNTKFKEDSLISSDITLYAKFVKNDENTTIRGDANGDGKITALDYVKVKNHIMKSSIITNSNELYGADMNGDGKITALDYVAIKNKIMKG